MTELQVRSQGPSPRQIDRVDVELTWPPPSDLLPSSSVSISSTVPACRQPDPSIRHAAPIHSRARARTVVARTASAAQEHVGQVHEKVQGGTPRTDRSVASFSPSAVGCDLETGAPIDVVFRSRRAGCLATVVALVAASSALQKGNRAQFNKMLRLRVAAQGLTVVAALGELRSRTLRSVPRSLKLRFVSVTLGLGGSVYFQGQRRAVREAEQRAKLAEAEAATPTPPVQV